MESFAVASAVLHLKMIPFTRCNLKWFQINRSINARIAMSALKYTKLKFVKMNGYYFGYVWLIEMKGYNDVVMIGSTMNRIEMDTKCSPFHRQYFQMHFLVWKCMNFGYIFTKFTELGWSIINTINMSYKGDPAYILFRILKPITFLISATTVAFAGMSETFKGGSIYVNSCQQLYCMTYISLIAISNYAL